MLPSEEAFAAHMEALGVTKSQPLVLYDGHGLLSAARAFWTMRCFGHRDVTILEGEFHSQPPARLTLT